MATAAVTDLNLQELDDFSTIKKFGMSTITRSSQSPGQVERMLSGRLISVRVPGSFVQWDVGLPFATRADVEWLRSREGDSFFVRTNHGEAFFAVLNNISQVEEFLPGTPSNAKVGSVTFTLAEVSLTVEV